MVADEGHLVGNAGFLGITHRRAHAAVRHGNDQIGFDLVFARELAAHFLADVIDGVPVNHAVGPREINIFKNA